MSIPAAHLSVCPFRLAMAPPHLRNLLVHFIVLLLQSPAHGTWRDETQAGAPTNLCFRLQFQLSGCSTVGLELRGLGLGPVRSG